MTARCSTEHFKPTDLIKMNMSQDKLSSAQWILERTLGWIAAAEIKVGAITAIDTLIKASASPPFHAAKHPSPLFQWHHRAAPTRTEPGTLLL